MVPIHSEQECTPRTQTVVWVWVIVERTPRENSMYYVGLHHCWLNTSVYIHVSARQVAYRVRTLAESVGQREIRNLSGGNVTCYLIAPAPLAPKTLPTIKSLSCRAIIVSLLLTPWALDTLELGYSFYSTNEYVSHTRQCDLLRSTTLRYVL